MVVISLAVGTLVGSINGLLITRFNVAPFIATLGMLYVARGLTEVLLGRAEHHQRTARGRSLDNTGFSSRSSPAGRSACRSRRG